MKKDQIKILLAEDDVNLGTLLKEFLQVKGFDVLHVLDGVDGSKSFKKEEFDLCILDIMMPQKDGFTLAKEIRAIDKNIPIIFLTAKSLLEDKIEGFNIGADDYMTKPFSTEELLLRINAILKRVQNEGTKLSSETKFSIGKYKFDYNNRELTHENNTEKLTSKEADLLRLFIIHSNETLSRKVALEHIWHEENYFTSRSMDVYVTKLRKYLDKDPTIQIINVHGQGFKLLINEK